MTDMRGMTGISGMRQWPSVLDIAGVRKHGRRGNRGFGFIDFGAMIFQIQSPKRVKNL